MPNRKGILTADRSWASKGGSSFFDSDDGPTLNSTVRLTTTAGVRSPKQNIFSPQFFAVPLVGQHGVGGDKHFRQPAASDSLTAAVLCNCSRSTRLYIATVLCRGLKISRHRRRLRPVSSRAVTGILLQRRGFGDFPERSFLVCNPSRPAASAGSKFQQFLPS